MNGRTWRAAFITAGVIATVTPAVVFTQAEREVITLGQAVSAALQHNNRMLNARDSLQQATLGVQLAEDAFDLKVVPNILGSFGQTNVGNQTYRLDILRRFTTGTELRLGAGTTSSQIPSPTAGLADVRFYNADTTLALSQPLLKGFGSSVTRRALTAAELRLADSERQISRTRQLLTVEVAASYYAVVAQQAMLAVADKSAERARKLVEASQAKLEAGLVSQLDVLRAQQLLTTAELQLSDSRTSVEDARDALAFLMGRDGTGTSFDIVADIPSAVDPLTVEDAVTMALSNRVDLWSAIAAVADAEQTVAYSRNQLLPQLDATLALTRRETSPSLRQSFGLSGYQFATFLAVSVPVDRTPQLIENQNAHIELDRRRRDVETLQRQISDDVRRVVRGRDRLQRDLVATANNVELARREVDVAQLRFERGLANNLDVVTAENNLLAAEGRHLTARAELALSRIRLRAIIGVLDPDKDITGDR